MNRSVRRDGGRRWCGACVASLLLLLPAGAAAESGWQETRWRGERAYRAAAGAWEAIVSVERARLVHLARVGGANLLFETATRDHPQGWGGHRVWLGPQGTWPQGWWPPPDAWEKAPAEGVSVANGRLELILPAAGHGWPRYSRTYHWDHDRLVCGVTVQPGGSVDAQVVQILQVPRDATVVGSLTPEPRWPAGYVGLRAGARREVESLATPPPHAEVAGGTLRLRHIGQVEKLGFRPQSLRASIGPATLTVGRGVSEGDVAGEPDAGFFTQVYLGGPEGFIELEQLSPLWRAGTGARFEMVIAPDSMQVP